jgi:hypothetical protein
VHKSIQPSYQKRYVFKFNYAFHLTLFLISYYESIKTPPHSLYSHVFKILLAKEIVALWIEFRSILILKMAVEMRSMAARSDMGVDPRTPKRQSLIRVLLSEKKRKSRGNPVLRPDPFRYGNPNPLGCHPYFSDKHPDYIIRPHTVSRPLSFPVLNPASEAPRLSIYEQDDLDAYRTQGFVPRLLRADSLVALLEFFDSNTLSRALASNLQPAKRPPKIPPHEQKMPPVNNFSSNGFICIFHHTLQQLTNLIQTSPRVRPYSDISLQSFVKSHEAAAAQNIEKGNTYLLDNNSTPLTPPPTPPKVYPEKSFVDWPREID